MKKEIQNLENKINDLVVRMNNAEETLTKIGTTEINSLRSELQKLITEFDLLKIKMQEENSDEVITQEMIDSLIDLIDDFIKNCGCEHFQDESFSHIEEYDLSINYSCEVELDSVTIDVDDYFCSKFSFDYERFIRWIEEYNEETISVGDKVIDSFKVRKFMSRELFELIAEIIDTSVRNINTSISFTTIDDFECEMDSYKKVEVTEVTIDYNEFCSVFTDEFDYDTSDIEDIIKNYHNFKSEDDSEDDSEK